MAKRLTTDQINEIIEFAKAGSSIERIAKEFKIGKTTVYYHARNYCQKTTKIDLNTLDESEKGYIIRFFLGDGDINRGRKAPRYIMRFYLDVKRDRDISTKLCQIFEKGRKKISLFPRDATLIVKVCSKELVNYIQTCIEYKRNQNNRKEKKLLRSKDWSLEFQYGILAGIIDSDGHVRKHLGTEIKTVSPLIFEEIVKILTNLEIKPKTRIRRATENSYSKKTRYVIYIPSAQTRAHRDKICSAKMERFILFFGFVAPWPGFEPGSRYRARSSVMSCGRQPRILFRH